MAKFLVPFLQPLTVNEFTVSDSFTFATEITTLNLGPSVYLCSFDVSSLFTNIPLQETIEICISELFLLTDTIANFDRNDFRKLLEMATMGCHFLFKGVLFEQVDGVAMGSPLGPSLANVFMCYFERQFLTNCPAEFKPIFCRRYIDDCFLVFRQRSHTQKFLDY